VILYYLWKSGLLAKADAEKLRYFFGFSANALTLSRRSPLVWAIHWPRALFSPSYARNVVRWLEYRVELFDGLQG
jgi:hypothetical protein